ncbi:MAG TPA: transketolase family protein [Clostridiales bacterium]|nr:transketolase family protein [Clostridiales bacterium]
MSEKIASRVAYGKALCEFGNNPDIVALDADLASCTMSVNFAEQYPERFYNIGIAEANMIDIAAGFAATGKIAFCHSFAMFTAGRGYDQIRNCVAYPHLNVKVVGSHAGLTVGEDGATHQCIEDVSLMRTIPDMTVVIPCDARETREAVKAMIAYDGPCYLRTSRLAVEEITDRVKDYKFELGKGIILKEGRDVTIAAYGIMVQKAYAAAEELEKEGISARVINLHTMKPFDKELILASAKETGAIVTVEEHNIIGGLGSAVSEVIAENVLVPVERVGVEDEFGHSGPAEALLERYGLTVENIVGKAKSAIERKAGKK